MNSPRLGLDEIGSGSDTIALLTFMYTDDFPEMKEQEESVRAQHLLVAADKCCLERLKLICEDKLCKRIDKDSIVNISILASSITVMGLRRHV
ncbi:hypothetical protein EJB05_22772, partial [Eragrostis curvula]